MTLQIRGTASNRSVGNGTSVALTIPASTQPGDLIVQLVQAAAATITQTLPGGWLSISALIASNSSSSLRGARRAAQVGDASSVATFTLNSSTRWVAVLVVVYDDAGAVPRIEQLTQAIAGNTTSPVTPSVDPQIANDLLLSVMSGTGSVAATEPAYVAGGGTVMQVQIASNSATLRNPSIGVSSLPLASDVAQPAITHSVSQTIAPATASILISTQNVGPVANAGPDQAVGPGVTVTLDGTGSNDFDGTIATYDWQQLSGSTVSLSDTSAVQPTFTAPISVEGAVLVFGLTVADNEGGISSEDTVTVTVGATSYEHVWNGVTMQKQPVRHWVGDTWVA